MVNLGPIRGVGTHMHCVTITKLVVDYVEHAKVY
jgi:hypothetical protein